MTLFILYFNEWGYEEGEDNQGQILGVFTTKTEAEKYQSMAEEKNTHGSYSITLIEVGKYYQYGC